MTIAKIIMMITVVVISSQAAMRKYNCSQTTTELPMQTTRKGFECIQDWGIVCVEDSQCCSKVCLKPFCKILGVPDSSTQKKPDQRPITDRTTTNPPTTTNPTTIATTPCTPCCNCKNNCNSCGCNN